MKCLENKRCKNGDLIFRRGYNVVLEVIQGMQAFDRQSSIFFTLHK